MAKKKSKTARKQQHVARKLAHSFAKKLGVSVESQRAAAQQSQVAVSKDIPKKVIVRKKGTKTSKKAGTTKRDRRAQERQERLMVQRQSQKKQHQKTDETKDDFGPEHASVQARGRAAALSTKGKSSTKTTPLHFAQPTFALYDHQKTTPQLLDETTQAVTALWGGTAGSNNNLPWTSAASSSQSSSSVFHPQAPPPSPTGVKPTVSTTNSTRVTPNNPFALLDNDDETKRPEHPSPTTSTAAAISAATTTPFTLAPPSFVLPSHNHKLDYDPEL